MITKEQVAQKAMDIYHLKPIKDPSGNIVRIYTLHPDVQERYNREAFDELYFSELADKAYAKFKASSNEQPKPE